jgi:hypothetical protein
MKRQAAFPKLVGATRASVVLLFWFGCVDLDKPENVKACAGSTAGCSDNPRFADAGSDGRALSDAWGPDLRIPQDGVSAEGRDALVLLDLPSELPGSPDGTDGAVHPEVTQLGEDAGGTDDAERDLPDFDTGTVDLVTPDLPELLDLPAALDLPSGPDLPVSLDLAGLDLAPPLDVGSDRGRLDTEPVNCILQIISNGYTAGTAPGCVACNDGNGNSLASKCRGMLDCLSPPRTSADFLFCRNQVSGTVQVGDCVTALTRVGCPTGY